MRRESIVLVGPMPSAHGAQSGVAHFTEWLADLLTSAGYSVSIVTNAGAKHETVIGWYPERFRLAHLVRVVRSRPGVVLFQHAPFVFGSTLLATLRPVFFILLLRLLGRRVVVEFHDIRALREINAEYAEKYNRGLPPGMLRLGLRVVVFAIAFFSNKVIIHAGAFRERLMEDYAVPGSKIATVAHLLPPTRRIPRYVARGRLGFNEDEFIFLFFGYFAEYKGLEELAIAWEKANKHSARLIVASGMNPMQSTDPNYARQYEATRASFSRLSSCNWLGFADDAEVDALFSAADALVLPYVRAVGASGPLSRALSAGMPVVVSQYVPVKGEAVHAYGTSEGLVQILNSLPLLPRESDDLRAKRGKRAFDELNNHVLGGYHAVL